jgi:cell division protein FtsQ
MRAYDETGRLLPLDPAKTHVDAPVLVERDTMLLRLLASLRASRRPLYDRVSSAKRAASRDELVVELNTLPVRTMANVTLERLADVEPVESDLARRQLHATEIDLRFRDQMIARLP